MNSASVWSRAVRLFAFLTPDAEDVWIDAIRAEVHAIPSAREQARFAISSMRGLLTISVGVCLRRWASHARALAIAVATGMGIATLDVLSETRWPLRVGLVLSCMAMGIGAPSVSRVSGLLLGLGLPTLTAVSGYRGPYKMDVGDVWIPVLPAIVLASAFGWIMEKFRDRDQT